MVAGLCIVFTHKAVVDETLIRKSTTLCKSIVAIGASQLYPHSMCQPKPTGSYKRWEYNNEIQRFISRQNKFPSFENMVVSHFQRTRPACRSESSLTTGLQKKIDCFSIDGVCHHGNIVFEAMGCYSHYFPSKISW